MKFIDGSADTKRDLQLIDNPSGKIPDPFVYIGLDRQDGRALEAGNLGLSGYEVAVGFAEGSNPSEAHRFADRVIGKLKQHWRVEILPPDTGALPMKNCGHQK